LRNKGEPLKMKKIITIVIAVVIVIAGTMAVVQKRKQSWRSGSQQVRKLWTNIATRKQSRPAK